MRILHIAPQFPYPQTDGGKIGIAKTFEGLEKAGGKITFCCYGNLNDKKIAGKMNKDFFIINHSTKNTILRLILSLFDLKPIYIRKHFNNRIKETFLANLSDNKFDLIIVEHSAMAELGLFAGEIFKAPVALRLDNVEYMIWERYAKSLKIWNPLKYYIGRQAQLLKRMEKKFYQEADICLAITDIDRQRAIELSPKAVVVISNPGINVNKWKPDPLVKRDFHTLALATNWKWIHNTNGMKWFVDNALPLVAKSVPDVKFKLYGANMDEVLSNYEKPNVKKIGFVENIVPELSQAGIYVAPLHVGSGVRIKILEAMSLGLPVVATRISAEGIWADEEHGLFVSDSPGVQAEIIIKLMNSPSEIIRLGLNARNFILENFNDDINYKKMYEIFVKLIDKR